jgi:hypothetical protein
MSSEKIQVSLKSDKNSGYFTCSPSYCYDSISLNFFRMRNVSDRNCRENQNKHFESFNFFPKIVPFMR